jgi:hypothetical protein
MAQIPSFGNVYLGYALNHGNTGATNTGNLNGWEASLEGKVLPFIGVVADFGAQYGTQGIAPAYGFGNESVRVESYLFGPRASVTLGKFRPFAHALIGAAHVNESSHGFLLNSESDFADALGGGVDYRLIPRVSWRIQLDDLQTRFNGGRQDNTRFSTGLAVRF